MKKDDFFQKKAKIEQIESPLTPDNCAIEQKNQITMEQQNMTFVTLKEFEQFARQVISDELKKGLSGLKTNKEDKLYSRTELAEVLGVTTTTITNYKNDGMPFRMVKRRPYFVFSEVENYMNLNKRKNKKG